MLPIGVPPLIAAARLERGDVLSCIHRAAGIDVNARGELGQTILFEIVSDQVYPFLEAHTLDLNAQNIDGNTALFAAFDRMDLPLFATLVKKGTDTGIRNGFGETVWEFAHAMTGTQLTPEPSDREAYIAKISALVRVAKEGRILST
jgi:hypothetical protein